MNNTILTVLSLSVSGSVLALIILALRPLLKNKVSKMFQYYVWLLVLLRLAVPLSFDGSVMNQIISQAGITNAVVVLAPDSSNGESTQGELAPQDNGQNTSQEVTTDGTVPANSVTDSGLPAASEPTRFNLLGFVLEHLTFIWLLGAALYLGWFIIAYLRFNRKIRRTSIQPNAKDMEEFAKLCGDTRVQLVCNPHITTPMLIGFLSPRIVVPQLAFVGNGIKAELVHILRHELTHYRRRDLLYKWFVVFVSALHWFNPLMILVRREISRACELSCDEAVIRSLDADERQDYGETLLAIASNKRLQTGIVATTMCEGKRELKERLESIMTYKSKSVVMVALSLVLALALAGCSVALGAANITDQIPDDVVSQSPAVTDTSSATTDPAGSKSDVKIQPLSNDPVLKAYQAVMNNEAEFYSTDNQKNLYLNDFLNNNEIYEVAFTVTQFAVLDMNGDGMSEVVLELSVADEPQFYEVLHNIDGVVYGYLIVYRGLEELKSDGTFYFSSGAADGGWGKLVFESTAITTDISGYSESTQDANGLTISYFVNDEAVTAESFESFSNEQAGKEDAVWYEFTQENIAAQLSVNS